MKAGILRTWRYGGDPPGRIHFIWRSPEGDRHLYQDPGGLLYTLLEAV